MVIVTYDLDISIFSDSTQKKYLEPGNKISSNDHADFNAQKIVRNPLLTQKFWSDFEFDSQKAKVTNSYPV